MNRYIDAEDFAAEVRKISKSPLNEWDTWGVLSALERVPTADVAPIIHAHWIVDDWGSYGVRNCSNCGGYGNDTHTHYGRTHGDVDGFRIEPLPYCPHCGAKMDEEV